MIPVPTGLLGGTAFAGIAAAIVALWKNIQIYLSKILSLIIYRGYYDCKNKYEYLCYFIFHNFLHFNKLLASIKIIPRLFTPSPKCFPQYLSHQKLCSTNSSSSVSTNFCFNSGF